VRVLVPVTVEQPASKAARSSVKRGSKLTLSCNISGAAKVRFSGPRTRTVSVKDGTVKIPTRSLRAGSSRVTVSWGEVVAEKMLRVRLR
jgi:hypothetical protein